MIQHIFKLIWTDRKFNIWILLELIIVFCIMWFCCEYLFVTAKHYLEPKGYDIENTYLIDFRNKRMEPTEKKDKTDYGKIIFDRIKMHPSIESICLSGGNHPYSGGSNGVSSLIVNDKDTLTRTGYAFEYYVSPTYFDVFRIRIEQGRVFDPLSNRESMLSPDENYAFFGKPVKEIHKFRKTFFDSKWGGGDMPEMNVTGVVNKIKFIEFEPYGGIIFYPRSENNINPIYNICVRVRPGIKNFPEQFEQEMSEQLSIGPYFLSKVTSFDDIRNRYMKKFSNYDSNFKSVMSITSFLLINIFLGVIGTFWFRTQSRKNEIGLRIAMGASKSSVKSMFIKEALLILFTASIIAAIVCINISLVDILKFIGLPSIDKEKFGISLNQYFINYLLTFSILLIMSVFAVWYPARKASEIPPVEALRDE